MRYIDESKVDLTRITELDKEESFVDLTSRKKMYMPKFLYEDPVIGQMYKTQGYQLGELNFYIKDLLKQCFIETATWGLDYWEYEYNIPTNKDDSYDIRRSRILAKIRGNNVTNVKQIKRVAVSFKCGEIEFIPHYEEYYFVIKFISVKGVPVNFKDFKDIIEEIKPAHLGVVYEYTWFRWGELYGTVSNPYKWEEIPKFTWGQVHVGEIYHGKHRNESVALVVNDGTEDSLLEDDLGNKIDLGGV